jgi:hypothetical protein
LSFKGVLEIDNKVFLATGCSDQVSFGSLLTNSSESYGHNLNISKIRIGLFSFVDLEILISSFLAQRQIFTIII